MSSKSPSASINGTGASNNTNKFIHKENNSNSHISDRYNSRNQIISGNSSLSIHANS